MIRRLLFFLLPILCCSSVLAQDIRFGDMQRGQRELTLMVGYGENHKIPSATKNRFAFDTAKIRYGVFTSPRAQLSFSLAVGDQRGEDNAAAWTTVGYRRNFMVRGSTSLGWDFNFGIVRFKDHVAELGTKTNFTEQLGLTFEHAVSDGSAISLEYVFSHVSNAGIKLPNIGINASMVAIGYSWFL